MSPYHERRRIPDRISFQKWQDRFEVLQIISPTPGMGGSRLERQSIVSRAHSPLGCRHGMALDNREGLGNGSLNFIMNCSARH